MSVNYVDKSTGDLIRVAGGGNDILYADSPIGSIIPFGGTTAPDGFLLCNGDQVSKTTYSELYAVIGDSFKGAKADPTSGNFYLPDLREVTLKGIGTNYAYAINNHGTINNVGGFMEDRVQDHIHDTYLNGDTNYPFGTKEGGDTGINYADVDRQVGAGWNVKANTIYTGRHGNTTEVKAVGVNYIIKATQVSAPADFMDAVEEAVETELEIKNITLTKVNVASNSGVMAKKSGSVVNVNFSALLTLDQTTSGGTILVSGFPKPVFDIVRFGLYDALAMDVTTGLVQIDSNGNLVADGQGLKPNTVYWGTFTYLTNE